MNLCTPDNIQYIYILFENLKIYSMIKFTLTNVYGHDIFRKHGQLIVFVR